MIDLTIEKAPSSVFRGRIPPEVEKRYLHTHSDTLKVLLTHIENSASVCLIGPSESGKSSLIKYLEANDEESVLIDLQGTFFGGNPLEELQEELKYAKSKKELDEGDEIKVIFIDELDALKVRDQRLTQEEQQELINFLLELKAKGICLVGTGHTPVAQINPKLAKVFENEIQMQEIPLEKRPTLKDIPDR